MTCCDKICQRAKVEPSGFIDSLAFSMGIGSDLAEQDCHTCADTGTGAAAGSSR